MINPLTVATNGYLANGISPLLVAVDGYLSWTPDQLIPGSSQVPDDGGGGWGRGGSGVLDELKRVNEQDELEILLICKAFLICH